MTVKLTANEIQALLIASSVALATPEGGDFGWGTAHVKLMKILERAQSKLQEAQHE